MDALSVDWTRLFQPSGSLLELVIRGSLLYLALFTMLRLLPRRQVGSVGVADLLVLMLLADAAQNGMSGEYTSVTEGVVLVATIFFWDYLIDWVDTRFPALRLSESGPLPLVRDGRLLRTNMDRERVSEEELMSQLRQHGVEDVASVKRAYVEGNGSISVIEKDDKGEKAARGAKSRVRRPPDMSRTEFQRRKGLCCARAEMIPCDSCPYRLRESGR
jgi:uncharacterized membrane protein YcaP (DUF421 family)